MSYKTKDGKVHQSTVLFGENGLPADTIATISGSYVFLEDPLPLVYTPLIAQVELPIGSDLTDVTLARARYTGKYILLTADNKLYYIDRVSINVANRTFTISTSDKVQVSPAVINLSAGWKVAEADIVNRLATTSAAKIDSIEFRDMHFQMQLDGDPVSVRGENGNTIEPNPDGSINVTFPPGMSIDVSLSPIKTPTIVNTPLAVANQEYMIALPKTTKRFMIKARSATRLYLTFASGATNYLTVEAGQMYSEDGLTLDQVLTIYIKSSKANAIIETLYWI